MSDNPIIPTMAYAVLWLAAGGLMIVNITGDVLGWWGHDHYTWWAALVVLLVLVVLESAEWLIGNRGPGGAA